MSDLMVLCRESAQVLRPARGAARNRPRGAPTGRCCASSGLPDPGKSTFLRCINHLEKIDAGRLSVDGELVGYRERGGKIYELPEREVCRKRAEIGMVFQQIQPLPPHDSARERPRGAGSR